MRITTTLLLALLLALPAPAGGAAPGQGALLRPHALVHGHSVLLSDLFADAPAIAAFPAPAPGTRQVLEAAQIARIARAYGITWRPAPGAERIVVERPGQPLPRAGAEAALRQALAPLGAGAEDGFDFASPMPMVSTQFEPFVSAEDAVFDRASGRFAATLVLEQGEAAPQRVRVMGRTWQAVAAAAPVRRIAAGEVIRPDDIRIERVRAERAQGLADPDAVAGLAARRPLAPGQLLAERDVGKPVIVARNSAVTVSLMIAGMSLAAQGRALEEGTQGAVIRVQNVASRAVLEAEVIGPGRVRVAPGSMPLVAPPRDARAAAQPR